MTKAQQYFDEQMQNKEFSQAYNEVSKKVDIEWELERVKNHVINGSTKDVIVQELEKLQEFIKNSIFIHSQNNTTQSV